MKDNKPLLFINSAQSKEIKDQNQYVYDSRFDKKDKNLVEAIKKEIPKENVEKKKEENKVVEVKEEKKDQVVDNKEEVENININKKLLNKMLLLNKRANLERYVLVSVKTNDKAIEGYFIKLLDNSIIIKIDNEEKEILITEIKDIVILKV